MRASARRHEPGRLPEEAGRIGEQLDEEIVDRLIERFPETKNAHVPNAEGHLARVIDRLHIESVLTEHRHEIVRPNEQHLLLAVMAGHDTRLMTVEDLCHHVRELALGGREFDSGNGTSCHAATLDQFGQLGQVGRVVSGFGRGPIRANIGEMTARKVDTAVAAIARRDPSIGEWAQVAADGLTAGEGAEMLTQAGVQDFLWYRLPAKYPERSWLPIARAAAALLDELGLDRYAAIAGSATTRTVLEAWGEDDTRGIARYRAAAEASGVKPPDTELLGWGSVMGLDEASAYSQTEWELERAIVSGALVPGSSGWRLRAASLTEHVLRGTAPNRAGRRWHELIIEERLRMWVDTAHPEALRRWRSAHADRRTGPSGPPEDLAPVTGPIRWLLQECRDGVELTQSGYLPPPMVRDGVERFGWWEWPGQPRSEADVHQLGALRETAARLRLVTRRGRRLATSRHGVALLADRPGLWRTIARTIGATDDYASLLSELIAHRLLEGPAFGDALEQAIVPIVTAQGWRTGGEPADERHIVLSVHRPLYFWRLFGLLDEVRPRWIDGHPTGPNVTSLTAEGRAAALEYLRARATAARTSLHT